MPLNDIRIAATTEQALRMLDNKIERVHRRARKDGYARYERQTAGTTAAGNNQLAFDTAVTAHADVVPSGAGNTAFQLAPGTWLVNLGGRVLDSTIFANMGQLSIATGSVAWSASRARVVGPVPINSGSCCLTVISDGTASSGAVTANFYSAVARTWDLTSVPHATFIEFTRIQ
ncbi:hypothetical protein ACWEOE_28870 [Amycolatopsis sp. NPDC004368]